MSDGVVEGADLAGRAQLIVGMGGTIRPSSSSARALRRALDEAEVAGARTMMFGSADLELPMYAPGQPDRHPQARRFVEAVAQADGLIVASPGYHGGISGQLKNALDYLEDLADAEPPYLLGRAVGCIVAASGWQAGITTLVSLRSVVHALRGWPTPLGVVINSAQRFEGDLTDTVGDQLKIMVGQVLELAELRELARTSAAARGVWSSSPASAAGQRVDR